MLPRMPKNGYYLSPAMSYREPLPPGCPPDEAEEIETSREVFRLVRTNPPTEKDFKSKRAENLVPKPQRVSECVFCGVSVFPKRRDAVAKTRKLPNFKGLLVCRVTLTAGAGKIQKTSPGGHHTWWPLADFDILDNCEVESP